MNLYTMDQITRKHLDNLHSVDLNFRSDTFQHLIKLTHNPVDWAYEVWDDLLTLLRSKDNHDRAIAAQVLSNLAKSDPKQRMLKDFDKLLIVTIRYDIIQVFRRLYDQVNDRKIREKALELIAIVEDTKYQKKYASLWKDIK